jgi:dihydrofolate reductase
MRKLVVTSLMSLDGYIEGPGKSIMVMPFDPFFDAYNLERQRAADTIVVGANTYRGMVNWWPAVADDPTVSPAVVADPSLAEQHREIAIHNRDLPKYVVSDSMTDEDTGPWKDTTTLVRRADARQAVARLKEQAGKDIVVFGSPTVWNDLLAAGLVDEIHLMVGAGVTGGGTPAFSSAPTPPLRLVDVVRREGAQAVVLRYEVDNH